ncbi:MAG TPA: imidazole glycerol phosphate synthase subunit HisH [Thermoplasmata archaeon]|nr:imidazole glycerol phosphate synthase subunit HisH [Thermoplasmata archaeon]
MIAIVDYGMGNLGSIQNMLKKIGAKVTITRDPATIGAADKIILPGVGAFDTAMENLNKLGLAPLLNDLALEKHRPILGICLGMQLMTKRSDEGALPGLGWVDAETVRFENGSLRVPHMGWNTVDIKREDPLFKGMYEEPRFYFVHSYFVKCAEDSDVLTSTRYGIDFCSSFVKGNIRGVQYHPEKSHKFGMLLLKNFAELV